MKLAERDTGDLEKNHVNGLQGPEADKSRTGKNVTRRPLETFVSLTPQWERTDLLLRSPLVHKNLPGVGLRALLVVSQWCQPGEGELSGHLGWGSAEVARHDGGMKCVFMKTLCFL